MRVSRLIACLTAMAFLLGITAWTHVARAEEKKETHDSGSLAKASQNPVAKMISVPFENVTSFNNGPEDAVGNVLSIKPVIPVNLTENWNLINRAIIPTIYQQERVSGEGDQSGIGDITYQGFISPAKPGKWIWGVGPQLSMPTGSARMTTDKWSLGPTAVLLTMPGHWVIGALVANIWSIGGATDSNAPDVNMFSAQYFITYNMKGGWYLSTTPTITANWEEDDSSNRWTVPVGGGFGRVFKIGKQPVNAGLKAYYNVESPDEASDWNITASITFLFPG